jgi:hypothetical protein
VPPTDPGKLTAVPENSVEMARRLGEVFLSKGFIKSRDIVGTLSIKELVWRLGSHATTENTRELGTLANTIANTYGQACCFKKGTWALVTVPTSVAHLD